MPLYARLKNLFCLLICFCTISAHAQNNASWKKIKEKNNIMVFTRSSSLSSVKEVRIVTFFQIGLDDFVEVLNDVAAYPEWVYKCTQARKMETLNEDEFVYYVVSDLPRPVRDRDVVIHSKQWFDQHSQAYFAKSVALPEYLKEFKGRVRIPLLQSNWKIVETEPQKVKIDYSIVAEPGGSIPNWIVNMAVSMGPIKTMEGLAEFIRKKKHLSARN